MAPEGGAMSGVVIEEGTTAMERESATLGGGEQMGDVVERDGGAVVDKREANALGDTEARLLKKRNDIQQKMQLYWEELRRKQRMERTWLDETGRPLEDPPDINYRRIIIREDEKIERLLLPDRFHFRVRCVRYQRYDVELESRPLKGYQSWTQAMEDNSKVQNDEERSTFFAGLRDAVAEDVDDVDEEILESEYVEGMVVGLSSDGVKNGNAPLFHKYEECWFYYDERKGDWHREPEEEGPQCDVRRQEWRREAFARPEQRYFDCVKCQFYCFDKKQNEWHGDGPVYAKHRPGYLEYDKEKCQWRAPDWLVKRQERDIADEKARSAPKEALKMDIETEGRYAANTDTPSPSPSTSTQAKIETQQNSTLQQAAYHIIWLIASFALSQVLRILHILQEAWYLEPKPTS